MGGCGNLTVEVHRIILKYFRLLDPFGDLLPAGFPPGP